MPKETSSLKKWIIQYRRTIFNAILNDFTVALPCSCLPAIYRIKEIEAGEYPGQAADIISQRLAELRPGIITQAVISFFIIMVVLFIPILIYRFRLEHQINLIQRLKEYFKKKEKEKNRNKTSNTR